MEKRTIKHKDERGVTEYIIYTKEEADEAGIEYLYWHDAEKGKYCISDDGYVAMCIDARWHQEHAIRPHSPMNKWVRTPYGGAYAKPGRNTAPLIVAEREKKNGINGKKYLTGARQRRGVQIARLYARTHDLEYSIQELESKNPDWGYMNWKAWCKSEEFKGMVGDELTKILAEKGFDRAQTLDLLKRTLGIAERKQNVGALLKAFELLAKMHGMDRPSQTKTTNILEARKVDGYLSDANKEEEMVEYRATKKEVIIDSSEPKINKGEISFEQDD